MIFEKEMDSMSWLNDLSDVHRKIFFSKFTLSSIFLEILQFLFKKTFHQPILIKLLKMP